MQWIQESHGSGKGYRSADGNLYIGQSPRKFYWVYARDALGDWKRQNYAATTLDLAKAHAENIWS